jgi:hypothetical protein
MRQFTVVASHSFAGLFFAHLLSRLLHLRRVARVRHAAIAVAHAHRARASINEERERQRQQHGNCENGLNSSHSD